MADRESLHLRWWPDYIDQKCVLCGERGEHSDTVVQTLPEGPVFATCIHRMPAQDTVQEIPSGLAQYGHDEDERHGPWPTSRAAGTYYEEHQSDKRD